MSSKSPTNHKIDVIQSASTSKPSIPQPMNSQIINNQHTAHVSQQHHSHLPLHFSQKTYGLPSTIPQAQKRHLVPPRYQEPPPVQSGILKNISIPRSGIPTLNNHQVNGAADLNAPLNLNLKFPQEVPKLTTVYIPDRSLANPSRIATARSLQPSRQSLNSQPSPQSTQLSTDDEHSVSNRQEMLKFVRKNETDSVPAHSPNPNVQTAANNFIRMNAAEQNRHFQSLLAELRSLKEVNQRLNDDNQELRDLCCFLDDDRQKGRKLAREWQRFGRYTASVMRQEVSAYQNKLCQLDNKQQELIRDNMELKELCLYLDEERANLAASIPASCSNCGTSIRSNVSTNATSNALRDDGDGSSSSTNDEPMPSARQFNRPVMDPNDRSALGDQTLQYVRSLERRLLEHENANSNTNGVENTNNVNQTNTNASKIPTSNPAAINKANEAMNSMRSLDLLSGRPEAVVRALQILEVREQLDCERGGNATSMSPEHMDDGEKALLREMCNVVWRKLEESPNNPDS